MRLSAPIHRLKRAARDHSRKATIPLTAALDKIAASEGFLSWSLLVAKMAEADSEPAAFFEALAPGELILIAARPFQGKTIFALYLAVAAVAAGREAHFFSLDYTMDDIARRLAGTPAPLARYTQRLNLDCSDAIAADYLITRLARAPRGAFVAVDYLQLLDQKRSSPPLQEQVAALAAFARKRGLIIAFICQIDRNFDPASHAVPGPEDIRLPNPLDLTLFTRAVFLHEGRLATLDMAR